MHRLLPYAPLIALAAACGGNEPEHPAEPPHEPAPPPAASEPAPTPTGPVTVTMKDATGKDVGTITVADTAGGTGVTLQLSLHDLPPGEHAIHFHEKPACDPPDFKSAGGHFNPEHKHHGLENPEGPHAGDMPNFDVQPDGTATTEIRDPNVTLGGSGANALTANGGTAIVIHAKEDDLKSDPAGNAGERIACGVVQAGQAAPGGTPTGGAPEGTNPSGATETPPSGGTTP